MEAVKTDLVRTRCGWRRSDGSRCRKTPFEAEIEADIVTIRPSAQAVLVPDTKPVPSGPGNVVLSISEARWQVTCPDPRCRARTITVRYSTVERAVRSAAETGQTTVWLTDIAT
jgi:hypothetical protein